VSEDLRTIDQEDKLRQVETLSRIGGILVLEEMEVPGDKARKSGRQKRGNGSRMDIETANRDNRCRPGKGRTRKKRKRKRKGEVSVVHLIHER